MSVGASANLAAFEVVDILDFLSKLSRSTLELVIHVRFFKGDRWMDGLSSQTINKGWMGGEVIAKGMVKKVIEPWAGLTIDE